MSTYIYRIIILFLLSLGSVWAENNPFLLEQSVYDIAVTQSKDSSEVRINLYGSNKLDNYLYQMFSKTENGDLILSDIRSTPSFSLVIDAMSTYQVGIAVLDSQGQYLHRSPIEIIEKGQFVHRENVFSGLASNMGVAITTGLNSTLNVNSDSFPFVFLEAGIEFNGTPYDGNPNNLPLLKKENFTATEDGRLQSITGVTPPSGQSSDKKIADIIFVHDDSGSLNDEAAQVKANITSFVNQLASNNIDYRVGLLPYGGGGGFSSPEGTLLHGGLLHDNASDFINDINQMRFDGGTERAFDAMYLGVTQTTWRKSTQKIVILITDEDNDSGSISESKITQTLKDNGVTVYGLTRGHSEFGRIATATKGKIFNITADFSSILADIGNKIGASYIVRYQTDNPNLDGKKRNVELTVKAKDPNGVEQEITVKGEYIATPPVSITLTPNTLDLSKKGQRQGAPLVISAKITRNGLVDNSIKASLFYKHAGSTGYNSVSMQDTGNGLYQASIPASIVSDPFVAYYITASGGKSTVSYPVSDPGNKPLTISILPNLKPTITHSPVFSSMENKDIKIAAIVEDRTNQVDSIVLFYRRSGEVSYTEIGTPFGKPSVSFSSTIPASSTVNTNGIEYYIEATDDFGVKSTYGTATNPLKIFISRITVPTSNFRDVGTIRVYADSFLDDKKAICKANFEKCIASGHVTLGTVKGNKNKPVPVLSFNASLELQGNSKKIISLNSGSIMALKIKRNVTLDPETIPLYNSNIEIDASNPIQDAVMTIKGGRSLLGLLGSLHLDSSTSIVTIKDDEVVIHSVVADITQYFSLPVALGDITLSQKGNSTGVVTFSTSNLLPITLPNCGSGGICSTKWKLGDLKLSLDLVNSAITGTANFNLSDLLGRSTNELSATLGFLTDPFALEAIGAGFKVSSTPFILPLTPPMGIGFDGLGFDVLNLSSATAPKITFTGPFSLNLAGKSIEVAGTTVMGGDIVLLVDLTGKYGARGDLKLLGLPLAQAKIIYENQSLTMEATVGLKFPTNKIALISLDGKIFLKTGYLNSYVSINGEYSGGMKLGQAVPWIGGKSISQIRLLLQSEFTTGNIRKAILAGDVQLFFIDIGVRFDLSDILSPHLYLRGWNKEIKVFRSTKYQRSLNQDSTTTEKVTVTSNLDVVVIKVESDSGAALFDIVFPDGSVFSPEKAKADNSSPNIDKIFFIRNENAHEAYYAIKKPEAGEYQLRLKNVADLGSYKAGIYTENKKPSINLVSQANDETWDGSSPISINWTDADEDDDAIISLYYDSDNTGADGVLITSGLSENDIKDGFEWDISKNIPASGSYYIYASIDDGEHMPVISYSTAKVKIDNSKAPTVPANFAIQAKDGYAIATWNANSEKNVTGYRLYLSETVGNSKYEYSFATGDNTTWKIPSLENGKTYEATLVAVNDASLESPKVSPLTFTPTGTAVGGSPDLMVDLTQSSFSSPTGKYDGLITVKFQVKNNGKYPVYTAKVDAYLGGTRKENLLGTTTIGLIDAGKFIDIEYTYDTNKLTNLDSGRQIYIEIRDVQLAELNTSNNVALLKNKLPSVNSSPKAVNDTATTKQDVAIKIPNVLLNDTDADNDTLTISAADSISKQGGTVINHNNGTFTYTPKAGFTGIDTFEYTVSDGKGGTDIGIVTITVEKVVVVNNPPVAVNDFLTLKENTTATSDDVLANDTDKDGDTLTITAFDAISKEGGTVVNNGNGTFTYTPKKDFKGQDSFTYTISDGKGATAIGRVDIDVTGECFIATAAFGSYLASDVKVLRHFRDDYLLTNTLGESFVEFYYENSPPIANYIAQRESLKTITRWTLTPLIYTIKYPIGSLLLVLLLVTGWKKRHFSFKKRYTQV